MDGVDEDFEFKGRDLAHNAPTGKKVHLGGRIIQAQVEDEEVVLLVAQLPIVHRPVYGPKETGKPTAKLAVFHRGKLDPTSLQPGNRLILVGTIKGDTAIAVDEVPHHVPMIVAECLHIWKTGRADVSDYGIGDEPLEENTICREDAHAQSTERH
jgi:starvation-inducible outer membrane lipoprotein